MIRVLTKCVVIPLAMLAGAFFMVAALLIDAAMILDKWGDI